MEADRHVERETGRGVRSKVQAHSLVSKIIVGYPDCYKTEV